MKRFVFASVFLLPLPAMAQAVSDQPSPQLQALQQTIIKLTGEAIDWQTQAITWKQEAEADRVKIAELQKQIAAKTLPTPPPQTQKKEP